MIPLSLFYIYFWVFFQLGWCEKERSAAGQDIRLQGKEQKDTISSVLDCISNSMAAKSLADLRFSSASEEDLGEILLTAITENTIHSKKTWLAMFLSQLEEKSIVIDLKMCQTR